MPSRKGCIWFALLSFCCWGVQGEGLAGSYVMHFLEVEGGLSQLEHCENRSSVFGFAFEQTIVIEEEEHEHFHVHPEPCEGEWTADSDNFIWIVCGDAMVTINATVPGEEIFIHVNSSDGQGACAYDFDISKAAARDMTAAWGYGILAVVIVCIVSLGGVGLLACGVPVEKYIYEMLALSAGTLLGSSCLSLLPETVEALGFTPVVGIVMLAGIMFGFLSELFLHMHQHTGVAEEVMVASPRDVDLEKPLANGKTEGIEPCATCENLCEQIGSKDNTHHETALAQEHHQYTGPGADEDELPPLELVSLKVEEGALGGGPPSPSNVPDKPLHGAVVTHTSSSKSTADREPKKTEPEPKKKDHHSDHGAGHLACINLLGDALHNFIDGALIGATFLESNKAGIAVTLAIVIHEFPQELADFSVLLHAGFSVKKALLMNVLVSLTAILGTVIALALGSRFGEGSNYVLPFAAGLFFYLPLAGLVPAIVLNLKSTASSKKRAAIMLLLVFLGIVIIGCVGLIPTGGGHSHSHGGGGDEHEGHGH